MVLLMQQIIHFGIRALEVSLLSASTYFSCNDNQKGKGTGTYYDVMPC